MSVTVFIPKKALDERLNDDTPITIEAGIVAYTSRGDNGKPLCAIFVDTSEHDALRRRVTKDFDPCSDWGKLLRELYKKNPELEQQLSQEAEFRVPAELLRIPHETSGHHGDLRLRYRNATVVYFPLDDFKYFRPEARCVPDGAVLCLEETARTDVD